MGNIGDIFLRLLADDSQLTGEVTKAAQKAGDAGSQTLGKSMAKGFATTAAKGFGVAASAAFGLAAKGALELENIQVDLQRETGLTAEEANKAAKAINGIAGRNVADLQDVSAAFAKVHNDLGLTGDAANQATEAFVKFGRATSQDAAGAVSAFDDILDAFGKTAEDAQGIMDQLVVSHQKYGGSIEENEAALAAMAPQLQALNLGLDEGIGLLNLFAASGLDASAGQKALNQAISKLPKGETLQQFLERLSKVTDDGERARLAMEVFGKKAGAGLANAIKPGVSSLQQFEVSAEDAAGATQKASDAIDSSFSGRIKKAISEASAALRGFGADFGPALTGLASISTLAATVFPGVGTKLAGGILGGLKGIGAKIMGAIAGEVATSTAGTAVGEVIGTNIGSGLAKSGAMGDAVAEGLDAAPRSSKLAGSIGKLRSFLTTKLGAGLVLGVTVTVAKVITDKLGEFQNDQVKGLFATANLEGLKNFLQAAKLQLAAQSSGPQGMIAEAAGLNDGLKTNIQEATDAIAELEARGTAGLQDAGKAMAGAAYDAGAGVPGAVSDGMRSAGPTTAAAAAAAGKDAVGAFAGGAADGAKQYAPTIRDGMNRLGEDAFGHQTFAQRLWAKGKDAILSFAQGIRDARQEPVDAMDALKEALKHPLTRMKEATRLAGQLASKELAAGMKSNDPAIRAQAHATQQIIVDRLKTLVKQGAPIGRDSMEALRKAMKSKDPDIARAANDIYQTIRSRLNKAKPAARAAGAQAGQNVASGINSKQGAVYQAALALAHKIAEGIRAGMGIGGKGGASSDPDIPHAKGGPVKAFQTYLVGEKGPEVFVSPRDGYILPNDWMSSLAVPRAHGWDGAMAPPSPSGPATVIQNYNIPLPGIVEVRTAEDIVRPLRQLADVGTFERDRRLVTANRRPVR